MRTHLINSTVARFAAGARHSRTHRALFRLARHNDFRCKRLTSSWVLGMRLHSLCGSGFTQANPRFVPEVSR